VRKLEGKRALRISRRRWENNIIIAINKKSMGELNGIYLVQSTGTWLAVVSTVMSFLVP
jgi:hypothetical protein